MPPLSKFLCRSVKGRSRVPAQQKLRPAFQPLERRDALSCRRYRQFASGQSDDTWYGQTRKQASEEAVEADTEVGLTVAATTFLTLLGEMLGLKAIDAEQRVVKAERAPAKAEQRAAEPEQAGARAGEPVGVAAKSTPRAMRLPWTSGENATKVTVGGREYAEIGGRLYVQHAVERMMPHGVSTYGRSIAPAYVEEAIKTGTTSTHVVDGVLRTVHSSGTLHIVTEDDGRIVVTVINTHN
jgi:hypothetical protein